MADEVKETMFCNHKVQLGETHELEDGSIVVADPYQSDLLSVLQLVRDVLSPCSHHLNAISDASIEIVRFRDATSRFKIGGHHVKSTKLNLIGDPRDIRPILEYLHWWNSVYRIKGVDCRRSITSTDRTLLPALVIFQFGFIPEFMERADWKILYFYGLRQEELDQYAKRKEAREQKKDYMTWQDFCLANQLWYDGAGDTLCDALRAAGLIDELTPEK